MDHGCDMRMRGVHGHDMRGWGGPWLWYEGWTIVVIDLKTTRMWCYSSKGKNLNTASNLFTSAQFHSLAAVNVSMMTFLPVIMWLNARICHMPVPMHQSEVWLVIVHASGVHAPVSRVAWCISLPCPAAASVTCPSICYSVTQVSPTPVTQLPECVPQQLLSYSVTQVPEWPTSGTTLQVRLSHGLRAVPIVILPLEI